MSRLGYCGDSIDLRPTTRNIDADETGALEVDRVSISIACPAKIATRAASRSSVERSDASDIQAREIRVAQSRIYRELRISDSIGRKERADCRSQRRIERVPGEAVPAHLDAGGDRTGEDGA